MKISLLCVREGRRSRLISYKVSLSLAFIDGGRGCEKFLFMSIPSHLVLHQKVTSWSQITELRLQFQMEIKYDIYYTISDMLCSMWSGINFGELISRIFDRCFSFSSMTCWFDEIFKTLSSWNYDSCDESFRTFSNSPVFGLNHVLKISAYVKYRYFNQSQLLFLSPCLEWVCQSHANCPHESITHRQLVLSPFK